MALIEAEIREDVFALFTQLIVSAAPIPVPTLDTLGPERLIANLAWSNVSIGDTPPGYSAPQGRLPAKADLKIGHVSIAELDMDSHALTETSATAWLLISVSPGRISVEAFQIDVAGKSPQVLSPQLPVGRFRFDLAAGVPVSTAAIARADGVVTLRFATNPSDDLTLPPANRLHDNPGTWVVRVSGDVFAEVIRDQLNSAVSPPPGGTTVEDAPSASWAPMGQGLSSWGVAASVGLKKSDACLTVLGYVDISVTVHADLTLSDDAQEPDLNRRLKVQLRVTSDASDWDSLRCWAGTGGIAAAMVGAVSNPVVGGLVGIGSLIAVGEFIRHETWNAVGEQDVGGDLVRVGGDSTSAIYEGHKRLPRLSAQIQSVNVGPDGLVISGALNVVPAIRTAVFDPDGGNLDGTWSGSYSCSSHQWVQTYNLPIISVSDTAFAPAGVIFSIVPITIWPTSTAAPSGEWIVEIPPPALPAQYVNITPPSGFAPGQSGRVYLHTSSGIRRFDITPVPEKPAAPAQGMLAAFEINCRKFQREWDRRMQLLWLVDPPPFDFGIAPLRQWLLVISEVPIGAALTVNTLRDGKNVSQAAAVTASRVGTLSVELVTDAATELMLEHNLDQTPEGARLVQRWLIPTLVMDLPGPVTALTRTGTTLACVAAGRVLTVDIGLGAVGPLSARDSVEGLHDVEGELLLSGDSAGARTVLEGTVPPFAITLPGGRVAAVWDSKLIVAIPWGP